MKKTHITPSKASFNQIARIRRDNTNYGDFSLATDGTMIYLGEQKLGEPAKQSFSICKANFNRLLRWYLKPSKFVRK